MQSRRSYGITFEESGKHRMIMCIVTGEMVDGSKVWTECDSNRNLINIDAQYTLQKRNGWQEFVKL